LDPFVRRRKGDTTTWFCEKIREFE
jgi:hypothetical protein